jgi:hypothetical protein
LAFALHPRNSESAGERTRTSNKQFLKLPRLPVAPRQQATLTDQSTEGGIRTHTVQFLRLTPPAGWATSASRTRQELNLRPRLSESRALVRLSYGSKHNQRKRWDSNPQRNGYRHLFSRQAPRPAGPLPREMEERTGVEPAQELPRMVSNHLPYH